MKIGQLCIFRLSSPAEHPYGAAVYGSRYQGQRGPTASRSWQNWRVWPTRGDDDTGRPRPESGAPPSSAR
jgi:dCTP deaminase